MFVGETSWSVGRARDVVLEFLPRLMQAGYFVQIALKLSEGSEAAIVSEEHPFAVYRDVLNVFVAERCGVRQ